MKTRCKFRVQKVAQCEWPGEVVTLAAQYDPNKNPEDVSFAESTPSGQMTFFVTNPAVVGTFKSGQEYYIDLIPIPAQ